MHNTDMDFGTDRGTPRFRARCSCGWVSEWYPRAGMTAAAIADHREAAERAGADPACQARWRMAV